LVDLAAAGPRLRPTYLSADLAGLFEPHTAPERDGDAWASGGWRAGVAGGRLDVAGEGDPDDWWRAVASAAWDHLDRTGDVADVAGLAAPDAESEQQEGSLTT